MPSGSLASAQECERTHSCPRARFQRISVCLVLSDSDSLSVFVQRELVGRACEEALAGAGAKMACWWDAGLRVHTMACVGRAAGATRGRTGCPFLARTHALVLGEGALKCTHTPRQSLATARARTFNRTSARTCTYTLAHRHLHKHAHDHTPPSTESRAHAITLVSVCTRTNTCVCLRVCTHCLRVRACGRTRTRSSLLLLLLLASSPPFLLSSSPPAPLLWRVSKWFRRQRYLQLPLARC
jgi:hypothetical protein